MVSPPDWVRDAVFYQILPDRFRRGADAWSVDPHAPGDREPRGGDLAGIQAALPYLQDLGVTALYLTPIFHANSYHKYDTVDYYAIDPGFGDDRSIRELVRELHDRGMKLVLDGVFNHCSVLHPFFQHVVSRGRGSTYWEWFDIRGDRVVFDPEPNYACWAGVRKMPEWNHRHPAAREYLLNVVRYWIEEFAIDGWRLDTVEYLPPDFVREIYRAAREASPEAYVLGEVMGLGTPWFKHDALDGVMHYRLWEALVAFLADEHWDAATFVANLRKLWHSYPEEANHASYTLLSSHDRPRFLTKCGGDSARAKLAHAFLLTYPGAPAIYYGDEIGLHGGDDPDNRRPFPWDERVWDRGLLEEVRRLVNLRGRKPALRRGSLAWLHAAGRCLAFQRAYENRRSVVTINAGRDQKAALPLPPGQWQDLLAGEALAGEASIPPLSYRVLLRS
ncbi:MAG: glycoside hydrolase family 13 protein [Candidatus Bipolaricaulota bacterium]|nr:MAG: glycoside hydrolase family 13 protein [Candidatus Bipolaricaulota bacterium]